ncbi:MAG TPA: thiamine pyrophosphate-dependent dehydrogenase E1 component subunit alpha [Chloroflexota bacterium]|nr:thiamine pyrophosphate-dependent dehydrogenase E1 component subunit alpha [Chloroflexota bacterium]
MAEALGADVLRDLLAQMLLIRRFEERLIHLREDAGLLRGHYHVYIGQEATAVAVCRRLVPADYLFTTHRNHGHLLARGVDPAALLAEILGRATGCNGGRGGTLHPVAPALGVLHTSAIVGGALPLAAGAALAARRRGTDTVAVVFFGDGALEEGAAYEALNLAALWRLPLLLVCENNSVPPALRRAGQYPSSTHAARELADVPRALQIPAVVVDGADPRAVDAAVAPLLARARAGEGPGFVEARNSRWPGSYPLWPTLVGADFELAWAWEPERVPAALAEWSASSDPILLLARDLLAAGAATRAELLALDGAARAAIAAAERAARAAPEPPAEQALAGVFASPE